MPVTHVNNVAIVIQHAEMVGLRHMATRLLVNLGDTARSTYADDGIGNSLP